MEEQHIIQPPVRMKIEEGAKGEVKVTISIDGDNDDAVRMRLVNQYKQLKTDLEIKKEG